MNPIHSAKKAIKAVCSSVGLEVHRATADPICTDILLNLRQLDSSTVTTSDAWALKLSEAAALTHLRKLILEREIDMVIDVGANKGQFATRLRRSGYKGTILSFEPAKEAYRDLLALSESDTKWSCFNLALGDQAGLQTLNILESSVFSSFHKPSTLAKQNFGNMTRVVQEQSVEVSTLDAFSETHPEFKKHTHIAIKSDTQGNDLAVLQGGESLLESTEIILTEVSFNPIYDDAPSEELMRCFLKDHGFCLSGLYPISFTQDESCQLIEADGLFTRLDTTNN